MVSEQRKKIHPHKFALWIAMGSITMMFAAFTSAYIVKRSQSNWLLFKLPILFWYSTGAILLSSATIQIALHAFRNRAMLLYKILITITTLLGLSFVALQCVGFATLHQQGVILLGNNSNASASFLTIIAGMHILHLLGGLIALVIIFCRAYSRRVRSYSSIPFEITSTYWHFVDFLWVYLFIFFEIMAG